MYDVEVIGAGPAGSYAANALARRGYSVHLVDRARFPRDKLCGGGLTRKSLDLVEDLEPSFRSSGLAEFVREVYLLAPDSVEVRSARLVSGAVALVHRSEFDSWWLGRAEDAGAEFSREPAGAKFVIAADGVTSELGKRIRGPFRNEEVAVATECFSLEGRDPFIAVSLPSRESPDPWGYSWLFGRSDSVAIGTGFRRDQDAHLTELRDRTTNVARRFGLRDFSPFRNWLIPLYRPRPAVRGNVALVGDALGTADPLLVEGIASGMTSAKILVEGFVRHGNFSSYESDLARHPYFRSMQYLELLQRIECEDPQKAFRVLSAPRIFDRLVRLLFEPEAAASLTHLFELRHPLWAHRERAAMKARAPGAAPARRPGASLAGRYPTGP